MKPHICPLLGESILLSLGRFTELLETMKCHKHPRYQAKSPPRVDCSECKALFVIKKKLRK